MGNMNHLPERGISIIAVFCYVGCPTDRVPSPGCNVFSLADRDRNHQSCLVMCVMVCHGHKMDLIAILGDGHQSIDMI